MEKTKNKINFKNLFIKEKSPSHVLSVIVIVVVGLIIYSNTFNSAFHIDDYHTIVDNSFIKSLNNFIDIGYWTKIINNRPLSYFTFALNYNFTQLSLDSFHILNIFIHILNGIVVYWLILLLFSTQYISKQKIFNYKNVIALFAALIFISHPVQTQAVTYIVQRMTSMASLFYLLSLCFYLNGRLIHTKDRLNFKSFLSYIISLLSFVLAIMSKEIAFTLPVIIILSELYFIRDKGNKIFWKYILIFTSILISGIIIKIFYSGLPHETTNISRIDYFLTQIKVLVIYLKLLVIPINQKVFYDITVTQNILNLWTLISLALILIILFVGIYLYKRERIISFCIFWFFITLSIESSIFPIRDLIFEHRLYLPLFGFALLITVLIFNLLSKNRLKLFLKFIIMLIIAYSFLTFIRNNDWKTEESLWTDNIDKTPDNPRVYYNRGNSFARFGPVDKSINDYSIAIKLDSTKFGYYNDRGFAFNRLGRYSLAISDFEKAVNLKPDLDAAYFNLGISYSRLKNYSEALKYFTKAIDINYKYTQAYIERGNAFAEIGNFEKAILEYSTAIKLNPNSENAYYNRGNIYNITGNYQKAIEDLNIVIKLNSKNEKAYKNRASAFYQIKNYDKAMNDYNYIIMLNPKDGESYYFRALCLYNLKKYSLALEDLNKSKENGYNISENLFLEFRNKLN